MSGDAPLTPAADTRFKKGRSGNPKGRPKGARNKATLLEEIVNEMIPVTDNGKRKMISKRAAALIQVANKAASGDLRAVAMLEKLYERYCQNKVSDPDTSSGQSPLTDSMTEEEAARLYSETIKKAKPE